MAKWPQILNPCPTVNKAQSCTKTLILMVKRILPSWMDETAVTVAPLFGSHATAPTRFPYMLMNAVVTILAQEYCGMFEVDHDQKKIYTMTKSGCCWHELSQFIIKDNKPFATKITFVDNYLPFEIITEQTWNGNTMVKKTTKTIDLEQEGIKLILSFIIPENGKKVVLYNINDRTLNYALVRKDNTVEFDYPVESVYQHPDFKFDCTPDNRSVTFSNKNATYKIEDHPNKLGIEITVGGQTYYLSGNQKTKTGGLDRLLSVQLDNVVNQN